jgi:hypothetical protein
MATITGVLGFPDASVMMFEDGGFVVAVVDPIHSASVRFRAEPPERGRLPEAWIAMIARIEAEPMAFQAAMVGLATFTRSGAEKAAEASPFGPQEGAKAKPCWDFLAAQRDARSLGIAVWTLAHHAQVEARMLAAATLAAFPEHDIAWWALADALRDANDLVKGTSQQALHYLAREHARSVDWGPAAPALRAVLDGTNLGAVPALARALLLTHVDPALAAPLLAGGGRGLLVYAPCERETLGGPVRSLLARLAGADHGKDAGRWKEWIAALAPADGPR